MRSEAWRPAAAARNRSPREAGTPPSRHYDLGARSSLQGSARQLPAVVGRRAPKEPEARPREPKTATVERREASVPRHGKLPLHSTPCGSILLDLMYCNVEIFIYKVLLRSLRLHSYILDTRRTSEPFPCPSRATRSSKAPPPAASWRCGRNPTGPRSAPASILATDATPGQAHGRCASPTAVLSGSSASRSLTISNLPVRPPF